MNFDTLMTFLRRLFHIRDTKRSYESPRYLLKWLFISTLIGVVAGIGAIAFYAAIHFATDLFLGHLVGYLPLNQRGKAVAWETPLSRSGHPLIPWLLPLVTTAGGLLAILSLAWLLKRRDMARMPPLALSIRGNRFELVFP